jgi:hypothetical protein
MDPLIAEHVEAPFYTYHLNDFVSQNCTEKQMSFIIQIRTNIRLYLFLFKMIKNTLLSCYIAFILWCSLVVANYCWVCQAIVEAEDFENQCQNVHGVYNRQYRSCRHLTEGQRDALLDSYESGTLGCHKSGAQTC